MGTAAKSNLGGFVVTRRRELVLLSSLFLGVFVLVSMIGWSSTDTSVWMEGAGNVANPCGVVGAFVAEWTFQGLGYGAWGIVPLLGIWVLNMAGRARLSVLQWVVASVIFACVMGMAQLGFRPGISFEPGGLLGWGVASGLEKAVGFVGAWLVLVSGVTVLLSWGAQIPWSRIAGLVIGKVEEQSPTIRRGAKSVARFSWSGVRLAGAKSVDVAGVAGRAAKSAGAGAGRAMTRMVASVFRGEGAADTMPELQRWETDHSEADELGVESVPEELLAEEPQSDSTQALAGRALVEVEWEPTRASQAGVESAVLDMFPEFAPRSSALESVVEHTPVVLAPRSVAPGDVVPSLQVDTAVADEALAGQEEAGELVDAIEVESSVVESEAQDMSMVQASIEGGVALPQAELGPAVRHNELLDLRVTDDGEAIREEVEWSLPKLSLLDDVPEQRASYDTDELRALGGLLEEKLASFRVFGKVAGVLPGPVVTIFEFLPDPGVKVSKIAGLSDDLAMALKAMRVRIVAPIPGRGVVGIEIPSKRRLTIYLREVLAHSSFRETQDALPCILGKDVEGRPVVSDLAKMPHLLVGGTTGSGKSVGVNGMLMSMLYTRSPEELRLLLIDPKMLEFEMYSGIPHLLHPVVTEAKIASQALAWACREMDDRYALLAKWGTRNIVGFNKKVERELANWSREKAVKYAPVGWSAEDPVPPKPSKLPYIVIVIDELADLMMVAGKEVEESICRIAQKARACGIHLIVATQRPSVDVVTGLIKANLPTRIAFTLRSRHDSRTVLDAIGAENLLGRGDMLFQPPGSNGLQRCHGAFVSDEEVGRVTTFLREQGSPEFIQSLEDNESTSGGFDAEMEDELYDDAVRIVVQAGKASTSMVQRHLKIGYNRAARIIDAMEAAGVIGPADGARPRAVLVAQ